VRIRLLEPIEAEAREQRRRALACLDAFTDPAFVTIEADVLRALQMGSTR